MDSADEGSSEHQADDDFSLDDLNDQSSKNMFIFAGTIHRSTSDAPKISNYRSTDPTMMRKAVFKGNIINTLLAEGKNSKSAMLRAFSNYQIGGSIGEGSFGKVFKGLNIKTGSFVAIKEIALTSKTIEDELPCIQKEIQVLKELNHPNIVHYIDCNQVENVCLHIVLEFVENGSLKDVISKFGPLQETLAARYSFQILQGLDYLHSLDILHRSIKGANILVTKTGICKLADFGITRFIHDVERSATGTTYWMAPEILESADATKGSDIWSFGCTVIELLTGSPPYRKFPEEVAICKILECVFPPLPPGISDELRDFLFSCFNKDTNKRATTKQLLNHPWILLNTPKPKRISGGEQEIYKDVNDVLCCYNKALDTKKPNGGLNKQEIEELVKVHSQDLLTKFKKKRTSQQHLNSFELNPDLLRKKFIESQVENQLLLEASDFVHQNLSKQLANISLHLKESSQELQESELRKASIAKKIAILEESFASVQSDTKLAKLIYGNRLPISHFANGIQGVLLLKKATKTAMQPGKQSKYKWTKRWMLLQDNFLMCYKAHEDMSDPVLIFRLQNHKIVPVAERDIGRKFCFLLSTASKAYYFSAANPQVLMKWINVLSDVTAWYQSDEILFRDWEIEEGKPLRKSDSDRGSEGRLKLNLNLSMLIPSRDSPATARAPPKPRKQSFGPTSPNRGPTSLSLTHKVPKSGRRISSKVSLTSPPSSPLNTPPSSPILSRRSPRNPKSK